MGRISPPSFARLHEPRNEVESRLAKALGHPNLKEPVPKIPDSPMLAGDEPIDATQHEKHVKNLTLRGLIRAAVVKGEIEPGPSR